MLVILRTGFNIIGVSAFTFDLIIGIAIIVSMIVNVQVARLREPGEAAVTRATARPTQSGSSTSRKSFGAVTALVDVSLHLRQGECLGLIGDNGAGKSTLIKILSGFHRPDTGRIFVDGEEVAAPLGRPRALARDRHRLPGSRARPDALAWRTTCS